MDQTDSSETFREIKSLLKITTNHSEIDKNELLTDILPKVLSLDLNHKTLIVLELLDRLDTESNMAWFIPALNKILTKICFIQQNIEQIAKKISEILEDTKILSKDSLIIILETVRHCFSKITNFFPRIFPFIMELAVCDIKELLPLMLKLPDKNILFISALICQNYIEHAYGDLTTIQADKCAEFYNMTPTFMGIFLDTTHYKNSLRCEFVNIFKIYLTAEKNIFKKPFLLAIYIIFASDSLLEPPKIINSLFKTTGIFYIFEQNQVSVEHLRSNDTLIDECFEHLLSIISPLDTKPYFDKIISNFLELGFFMLREKNIKISHEWINKRGEFLIFFLFKNYQELQVAIVQRVLNEILVSNKPIFASLLHSCCEFSQLALMACMTHVDSTLQSLISFDTNRAKTFMSFIMPFIKINGNMKDSFLLILRQSMLSKNREEQYVSILGYMMILKNFRTIRGEIDLSQCTQFASDTYGLTQKLRNLSPDQIPSLCNEMICLEIFQYIKRCFCLHDEVKNFIFQGLKEVAVHNNQLIDPILDILIYQYQTNTQTSKEDSFSKNESSTQEPTNFSLPFLLSAMVYCLNISKKLIQQSNREFSKRENIANRILSDLVEKISDENYSKDNCLIDSNISMVLLEYSTFLSTDIEENKRIEIFSYYQKNKIKVLGGTNYHGKKECCLLSLKFVMSEIWKFIDPNHSDFYKNKFYCKFIWKNMAKATAFYINNMTQIIDDGKTVCQKLSSTIEFCCRIITNSAVLFNCVEEEKELDDLLEQCIEILNQIVFDLFLRYSKIPSYLLKDMDNYLDVELSDPHTTVSNIMIKMITILDQSNSTIVIINQNSCKTLLKMLALIFNSSSTDKKTCDLVKCHLFALFQTSSYTTEEKSNVDILIDLFLGSLTDISCDIESTSIIATQIFIFAKQSQKNFEIPELYIKIINIYTLSSIINKMLAFFTKCIETNVLKIQQIRNRCKIFKTIISNQRKFKISSSSQGSFSEILTTLKSEENQQICDDFNEIFKILNTFTNPCLLSDCYLQYCKTVLSYYNGLTSYLISQKELLSIKQLDSISDDFVTLIKKISSSLTPAVHSIIARFGASNTKENIEDLKPTKRKKKDISTFGELRIVPNLVYALEYFEKESLSAGKLSKMDLTIGCKSNTARDFRIDLSKI